MFRKRKKKTKKIPSEKASSSTGDKAETDVLAIKIKSIKKSRRVVLLAAERLSDLPVTVAVHLGLHLANSKRCLVIDLDIKRDSLATVFDIDSSSIDITLKLLPLSTAVDNLSIWPARFFGLLRQMNLKDLIESAEIKFDTILLYAPYLPALVDRRQIASLCDQAIVFSSENKNSNLYQLLENSKCKILHEV